jgi:hypothetical protein
MEFIHDAGKDLNIFMAAFKRGEQIGFARFGDGEERICRGGTYHCSDGWVSRPSKNSRLRKQLAASFRFSHAKYYVGLRYPRSLKFWAWVTRQLGTPPERVCDPCLFVNSRWRKARKFFLKQRRKCFLVSCAKSADFRIPKNCINPEYNWDRLLKRLLKVNKPILLAAGPLANVLVMEYLAAGGKQSIIDIGTVLDYELLGRPTRKYMRKALSKKARKTSKPPKRPRPKPRAGRKAAPQRVPVKARAGRPLSAIRVENHLRKKHMRARRKK